MHAPDGAKLLRNFALNIAGFRATGRCTRSRSASPFACALRAVTSTDGMTADYYPFDHAFLGRVANRIINEVRGSIG